jgi:hypothetical protein
MLTTALLLIIIEYTGVLLAIIADLASGLRKARAKRIPHTSRALRRTVDKIARYFNALFALTILDGMIIAGIVYLRTTDVATFPIIPIFSMLGAIALTIIEIKSICEKVLGTTSIPRADGGTIELGGEWREVDYKDLIIEATGNPDWFSLSRDEKLAAAKALAKKTNSDIELSDDLEDYEITNNVYGKLVEPNLIQPTFVCTFLANFVHWLNSIRTILAFSMFSNFA